MTDGYHSGQRYSVVREVRAGGARTDYVVIDTRQGNVRVSRHGSSAAAHKKADRLNKAVA